jgi:uncharacterized phage-associated protein
MYDARQIANWFIQRAQHDGRTLSIMQLLKLIYISHGWYMEMSSAPLIRNKIEAWKYGPVIPDVYNAFRRQGVNVSNIDTTHNAPVDAYTANILDQIYGSYGQIPATRLSDMTHVPGGPWDIASRTGGYFAPISNDLILSHYRAKRSESMSRVNG